MSLVLTSNTTSNDNGNGPGNSGLNLPYSYHNYLSNALTLPANAEVAVQSVKVNKEGEISVNRANNQYYIYIGDNRDGSRSIDETTSTPLHTYVNKSESKNSTMGTNQLAEEIEISMNRGVFHPNLLKSTINSSGCQCNASRNASLLSFEGFDFQFNQSASNASDLKSTMEFENALVAPQFAAGVWDSGSHTIKCVHDADSDIAEMIATGHPISHTGGTFHFSFLEMGNEFWQAGLTRFLDTSAGEYMEQNCAYFSNMGQTQFDWVVKPVLNVSNSKFYLKVFHLIKDPTAENFIDLVEFDYSHVVAAPGIEVFNASSDYNASTVSEVIFKIENERVSLTCQSANGLTKHVLADGTNASKVKNLKPTCSTTKWLYPKVRLRENNSICTIKEYKAVNVDDFEYGDKRQRIGWNRVLNPNLVVNDMDWWCKLIMTDQDYEYGQPIDTRYMFDYSDATSGPSGNGEYSQFGLNASGGLNASIVMILKEDKDVLPNYYGYSPSAGANAIDLFGFSNVPILRIPTTSSEAGNKISYISSSIPKMISTNSIFVRLDNYSQLSFNAQTGSPSKILYHLPRFANDGSEFGALYFEPTERTYIKLDNPNAISINDFSITLCNPDETLANNLTGKTIVMLHFRKSLN